jgi:hypothetical protein
MLVYWFCLLWGAIPADEASRSLCVFFSMVETGVEIAVIVALILNWLDYKRRK